jgi:aminopeptidase N
MNNTNNTVSPTIYLKDYTPPAWWIDTVDLKVEIKADATHVSATLALRRNAQVPPQPLALDGKGLETLAVTVDGQPARYTLTPTQLTVHDLPDTCTLRTEVRIQPDRNTTLSGFYRSQDGYFTQCEAQGFRAITWFLDRPDVMSTYTVTLTADQARFPVLLANGNPVAQGETGDGRHWAKWADPFKKPAYLFAMVAARLDVLRDSFTTASGRDVQLAVYVEPGKLDQTPHAMAALKKSMRWDEERFGLECDLDHYMIVAVGDFNMGAMENKGLNIFNTKYVLARADTATDTDFENIDRVVAHEYFHNWTGNRVTCRDWFQLSLKEGLTVFRDQEFGADTHERQTARIREVRGLRAAQFPEDAGPMAHPVRPASYIEINNFYTATVYEKGAEVIRMIQTLIGRDAFRAGMDEYFRRHDGQAVTCEDFIAAMSSASGFDFGQFMRWYREPGTPRVKVSAHYDANACSYSIDCEQENPQASDASPYLIPLRIALFDANGQMLPDSERTLLLNETRQRFTFTAISAPPVPSLLRDFSAPIYLDFAYTPEQLSLLLAHESDPFSAWEAGQRLASGLIFSAMRALQQKIPLPAPDTFIAACRHLLLTRAAQSPALVAEMLTLPGDATLAEQLPAPVDPDALHAARQWLRQSLAQALEESFHTLYQQLENRETYAPEGPQVGRRALRQICLGYLLECPAPHYRALALSQLREATNMTDQFAALSALANVTTPDCPERDAALAEFYARWQHEPLVVDKWLQVQASSRQPQTLARVRELSAHAAFDPANPNKVYALWRAFGGNFLHFHAADGSGYAFLAEKIAFLQRKNPQVASRLARCFDRWRQFDTPRQQHARRALQGLLDLPDLVSDVREVVSRALAANQ